MLGRRDSECMAILQGSRASIVRVVLREEQQAGRRPQGGAARGRVSAWFITPAPDFTKEKGGEPCWFLIKPLCLCSFTLSPSSDGLPDFLSLLSDLLEPFLLSPLASPGPAVCRPLSHPPCCPPLPSPACPPAHAPGSPSFHPPPFHPSPPPLRVLSKSYCLFYVSPGFFLLPPPRAQFFCVLGIPQLMPLMAS